MLVRFFESVCHVKIIQCLSQLSFLVTAVPGVLHIPCRVTIYEFLAIKSLLMYSKVVTGTPPAEGENFF